MKKVISLILFSVVFLIGCNSTSTNTENTELISGYFAYSDNNFIYVDISYAYIEYAKENNLTYEDDQKQIKVKRTNALKIVDQTGESFYLKDLQRGDKVYLEYDIANYNADNIEIETQKILVE